MAIPIIVCGQTEKIGAGVVEGLKPEIEGTTTSAYLMAKQRNASANLVASRLLSPLLRRRKD